MKEYIIVGDTKEFKGCLIYTCGTSKEHAEEVLNKMLTNPSEQDKKVLEEHSNVRIAEEESENCWWNQGGLD